MPAPGKPFEVFVQEDRQCRAFAEQSIGMNTTDRAAENLVGSAAVGTAIGAAAGALAGGNRGAATGAAVGMVAGTASGTSNAAYAGAEAQRRYDIAYQQCMYAKGNQLPGSGYGYRQPTPAAGTLITIRHLRRRRAEAGRQALRVTSPAPCGTIPAQEIHP
jgi:hypothetical protein